MNHFYNNLGFSKILNFSHPLVKETVLATIKIKDLTLPIHAWVIGSSDLSKPTLGLFGGVHGVERIGTEVVTAYLASLFARLKWDQQLQKFFESVRLVSIPLLNPGGAYLQTRANPNGVDLMRNAPVDADKPMFLVGGHRISSKLPWYRGSVPHQLELESQVLIDFVKQEMFNAKQAIAVDFHSGFGLRDRLWFPFAKTTQPFPKTAEVKALKHLLDQTYSNHIYTIEPQANQYTTHGDLYDYLFAEFESSKLNEKQIFLPFTLEMGSWLWVKKNPIQALIPGGIYNPLAPHRRARVLRRHIQLIDFFLQAVNNRKAWLQ